MVMRIFLVVSGLLASLNLTGVAKDAPGPVLFEYQGKTFRQSDLNPALQQALFDAEKARHDAIARVVEGAILEQYVLDQASKTHRARSAVEASLFETHVSEAAAQSFYNENKARLGGRDYASIKAELMHYLSRQEQEKIRAQLVTKVQKEGKFKFGLVEPEAPQFQINSQGYPSKGPDTAKVTIVEFADYTCPHCQLASNSLKKVWELYKDQVKIVFMDFPLQTGGLSSQIATGAACADAQGKFWDYHYMAFGEQAALNQESPTNIAKKLKLDENKFKSCLSTEAPRKRIDSARVEGERLGIQGTPVLYLNGRRIAGYNEEVLIAAIKAAL